LRLFFNSKTNSIGSWKSGHLSEEPSHPFSAKTPFMQKILVAIETRVSAKVSRK
jgi:hypothetical protein